MRINKGCLSQISGYVAAGLMILITTVWTYWGVAEMYHEGWWGAWYNRLPYLVPGAICLALTLVALTWPRLGGANFCHRECAASPWDSAQPPRGRGHGEKI